MMNETKVLYSECQCMITTVLLYTSVTAEPPQSHTEPSLECTWAWPLLEAATAADLSL